MRASEIDPQRRQQSNARTGSISRTARRVGGRRPERDGPEIAYQSLIYPSVGIEEDQASVHENTASIVVRRKGL